MAAFNGRLTLWRKLMRDCPNWGISRDPAFRSIFRRKPAPDSIRGVQWFAAENATNARNLEHDPIPKERIILEGLEARVPRLSAIVITKNEAGNIGDCLESLAFCDERIVVDSGSSDQTLVIAKAKGARVAAHSWKGFG